MTEREIDYEEQNDIENENSNSVNQNDIVYQKPMIKINNTENNINSNILKEIRKSIRENEIKMDKVNKTMLDYMINNKDNLNNTRSYLTQMNEIEKIHQENATLKADAIIYREDLVHLNMINKKLSEELELVKQKIKNIITKIDESEKILMSKNFEINQLTETLTNLNITESTSNNTSLLMKLNTNRTKDQIIFEMQFNLKNLNNEKIKTEVEKKVLEEKYLYLLSEKEKIEKNDENYGIKISNMLNNFDTKIQKLQYEIENLAKKNNELKFLNKKYNDNILVLNKEKEEFNNKYENKKNEYERMSKEYKDLEVKYNQLLYDRQKQKYIIAKMQSEKAKILEKEYKMKKKQNNKKEVINDLYNRIQMLKCKVKTERDSEI